MNWVGHDVGRIVSAQVQRLITRQEEFKCGLQ
jgi:hypothetical protein